MPRKKIHADRDSIFELFTIGIGPSSSHTVGPMRAALDFTQKIKRCRKSAKLYRIHCEFFGSLAATGKGHGADRATILGLMGKTPDAVTSKEIEEIPQTVTEKQELTLAGGKNIHFEPKRDLQFQHFEPLPLHPNAMCFQAVDVEERVILEETYYSVGGGSIRTETEMMGKKTEKVILPYPFKSSADILNHCHVLYAPWSKVCLENEKVFRSEKEIFNQLDLLWTTMQDSAQRGLQQEGVLPGKLKIRRRAKLMMQSLRNRKPSEALHTMGMLDWINTYALAVNEENAAFGRIVTAPTNGAAGILPAVMLFAKHFYTRFSPEAARNMLLTAGLIGLLYKKNASISGADVGCQGEIGVAASMAAGAFTQFLGGTPEQVENAAEIAMEHHLGLTCDPIGGLVQIPCIERNAMGAIQAINAARLGLQGKGEHAVSLDRVIETMKATGRDMLDKYKETARGGLAVHVVEC